jgi:hypothetical protein
MQMASDFRIESSTPKSTCTQRAVGRFRKSPSALTAANGIPYHMDQGFRWQIIGCVRISSLRARC